MSNYRHDADEDDVEEILDPPKFRLPSNFDSDRFEVWTVRVPRDFNLADLNGARFPFNHHHSKQRSEETVDFTSRKGNQKFTLQWGDPREAECFRMILPKSNDSDADDSDDDDGTFLYPAEIPFVRHASMLPAIQHQTQFELAPSMENAPPPAQENAVRHSYAPVPQKQGLKRRWTPLGGNTTVATSLPLKRKMKSSQEHHTNGHTKNRVIKNEYHDDGMPNVTTSTTNGDKKNRIVKDESDTPMSPASDRKKTKKGDPETPVSDQKKVKKEKKSEKKEKKSEKKSEKKEKKKKKKVKSES